MRCTSFTASYAGSLEAIRKFPPDIRRHAGYQQ